MNEEKEIVNEEEMYIHRGYVTREGTWVRVRDSTSRYDGWNYPVKGVAPGHQITNGADVEFQLIPAGNLHDGENSPNLVAVNVRTFPVTK